MDTRPPLPLIVVIRTGEILCPMKQGIIALEGCMALHQDRPLRCGELKCHHVGHQARFADEQLRSRGLPVPVRKEPGKRPWLQTREARNG